MSAPAATAAKTAAPKPAARVKTRQQMRLQVGAEGDTLEREADRLADGVLARCPTPITELRGTGLPRTIGLAPPSVEDSLATPGEPLEPAVRGGMEQRASDTISPASTSTATSTRIELCAISAPKPLRSAATSCSGKTVTPRRRRPAFTCWRTSSHMRMHLVGVKAHTDLKEVLKREFPGKFSETVAGGLKFLDDAADTIDAITSLGGVLRDRAPPADSALGGREVPVGESVRHRCRLDAAFLLGGHQARARRHRRAAEPLLRRGRATMRGGCT